MDNAAIIALAATLEMDFEPLKKRLEEVAREQDDVQGVAMELREALPEILAVALLSGNARNLLANAMATHYAEGVAHGSGRAVKNTGKIMKSHLAFDAVRESAILDGAPNGVAEAEAAIEVRANGVAKILKAQIVQDVRDALDKASGDEDALVQIATELAVKLENLTANSHVRQHADINTEAAKGYGAFSARQTRDWLRVHQYQELFRAEHREEWRDWPGRWLQLGGTFYQHGPSDYSEGRMIAPMDSPLWDHISDPSIFPDGTGSPYAPFAWGSGMDVKPVAPSELPALGLVKKMIHPRKLGFNANLQFSSTDMDDDIKNVVMLSLPEFREEVRT